LKYIVVVFSAASSVSLSADRQRALLVDFSCAVHQPTVLADDLVDVVREVLPPHLIAPEVPALHCHGRNLKSGLGYEMAVMVHRCLNGRAPQYLAVRCVPLSSQRHLHSAERNLLHVPRHRLNTYGRPRAFATAGSSVWNSLPALSATRTPPKLLSGV